MTESAVAKAMERLEMERRASLYARLVAMLKQVEWTTLGGHPACPECHCYSAELEDAWGHDPDCELALLLKEAE